MNKYVERVDHLIRVVSAVPDDKFNLGFWWNPLTKCGCAIGHAMQDRYFIKQGIGDVRGPDSIKELAAFFDISPYRAISLFLVNNNYRTRTDVLSAIRVLLMEKEAEVVASTPSIVVAILAADVRADIAAGIDG